MKIKNKNGAEKIISVYWFAILLIVAGGIVYMVSAFYGNPYDVRSLESGVLISKIAECVSDNSIESLKSDLFKTCHLNFNTNTEDEKYFVEIVFYEFENQDIKIDEISAGNVNLKDNPSFDEFSKFSKNLYVIKEDKELVAKLNVVINKENENVEQ